MMMGRGLIRSAARAKKNKLFQKSFYLKIIGK
jgi:hypothetical protein